MSGGVRRTILVALAAVGVGCSATRGAVRPLRVTATETGGEVEFTLQEPIEAVSCVERDFRRSPSDPAATRVIWRARCAAGDDCLPSVRYADRRLESFTPAAPLRPSTEGTCYECIVESRGGRGLVSFRITPKGSFDRCSPRVGDL